MRKPLNLEVTYYQKYIYLTYLNLSSIHIKLNFVSPQRMHPIMAAPGKE